MSPSSRPSLSFRFDRPGLRGYGLAAAAVVLAVALMWTLHLAGVAMAGPVMLVAVGVGFLYGGIGPGLLALIASALLTRDPVVVVGGVLLGLACEIFRRGTLRPEGLITSETSTVQPAAEPVVSTPPITARNSFPQETSSEGSPLREVTTEATWRFHHDEPLDITLPEDEQIEHLYLYSVLAECNDAFARMYGFRTAADVVGTRLVVFLPPSNPANVEYLRNFIRSGYRLEDADSHEIDRYGRAKYFVNNLVGIFERGRLVGAWGTQRDVTDSRRGPTQEYRSRVHSSNSSSQ